MDEKKLTQNELKAIVYTNMIGETLHECDNYDQLSNKIKLKIDILVSQLNKLMDRNCSD